MAGERMGGYEPWGHEAETTADVLNRAQEDKETRAPTHTYVQEEEEEEMRSPIGAPPRASPMVPAASPPPRLGTWPLVG